MKRNLLIVLSSAAVGGLIAALGTGILLAPRTSPPPAPGNAGSATSELEPPALPKRPYPPPLIGFDGIIEPTAQPNPAQIWRQPDGELEIHIPAGALATPVEIVAESVPLASLPTPPPGTVAVFAFGPDGLSFRQPVAVQARVHRLSQGDATGRLWLLDEPAGRWVDENTPVSFHGDHASFTLRHFSDYALAEDDAKADPDDTLSLDFNELREQTPKTPRPDLGPPPPPPAADTPSFAWSAGGGTAELTLAGIQLGREGTAPQSATLLVLPGEAVQVDVDLALRGTAGAEAKFTLELVHVSQKGAVRVATVPVSRTLTGNAAGEAFAGFTERIVVRADPARLGEDGYFQVTAVAAGGGRAQLAAQTEVLQIRAYPLGRLRLLPEPTDPPPGFSTDFAPVDEKDLVLAIPREQQEPFAALDKVPFRVRIRAPGGRVFDQEVIATAAAGQFPLRVHDLVPADALDPGIWHFAVSQGPPDWSHAELTASLFARGTTPARLRNTNDAQRSVRLEPRPPLSIPSAPEVRAGYRLQLRGRDMTAAFCERGMVLSTPVELHAGRAWVAEPDGGIALDRAALARTLNRLREGDPRATLEFSASAELWAGRSVGGRFHPIYRCAAESGPPTTTAPPTAVPTPRAAPAEVVAGIRFTSFGLAQGTGQEGRTFTDQSLDHARGEQPCFAVLGYEVTAPADPRARVLVPDEFTAVVSRDGKGVLFLRRSKSTGSSDPGSNATAFAPGPHRIYATEWSATAAGPWQAAPFALPAGSYHFAAEFARSDDGARAVMAQTDHNFQVIRDGFRLAKVAITRNEKEDVTGSAAYADGRLTVTSTRLVSTRSVDSELKQPLWVHHVVRWNDDPQDFWLVTGRAADGDKLVTDNEQGKLHYRVAGGKGPFRGRWALEDAMQGLRSGGSEVSVHAPAQAMINAAGTGTPDVGVGGSGVASFEFTGLEFLPLADPGELGVTVHVNALAAVKGKGKGRIATVFFESAPDRLRACRVQPRTDGKIGAVGFQPGEFAAGETARATYQLATDRYGSWKGLRLELVLVHSGARGGGTTKVTLTYGRDPVTEVQLGDGVSANAVPIGLPAPAGEVGSAAAEPDGGSADGGSGGMENLILLLDLMGDQLMFIPIGGLPIPVDEAQPLSRGTLTTGEASSATVRFPDGSRVRVGPGSRLRLPDDEFGAGAPRGSLDLGTAGVDVRRENPARPPLQMDTPDVRVTVRGTRYHLRVDAQGTNVRVDEGTTHLAGPRLRKQGAPTTTTELVLAAGEEALAMRAAPAGVAPASDATADWTGALGAAANTIGGAPDAAAVLASAEPWMDQRVAALIDEFLRVSEPARMPGPGYRWDRWARVHGPGMRYTNDRPDGESEATRHQWLWTRAEKIPSVRHMTMAEYVRRRLLGQELDATPIAAPRPPTPHPPGGEPPAPSDAEHTGDARTRNDAAIAAIDTFIANQGPDRQNAAWRTSLARPPQLRFDPSAAYEWHVATNKGTLAIRLLPEIAPMHVSSTIYLARLGFYDGLSFHRVIGGFMAQGGCPLGRGNGGPGYKMAGEFDAGTTHDKRGMLSAANAGPGTDGSQFFLTFAPATNLDGKYTIFGTVTTGMDVLDALAACGSDSGTPTEKLTIERTWIVVVPKPRAAQSEPKRDTRKK